MKTLPFQPYEIDVVPDITGATLASIDSEMFGQDKERLHIAHGEFACLTIALDNGKNYVVTKIELLSVVLDALKPLEWIIQNATYDIRQMRRFVQIDPRPIFDPMLVEKDLWGGYYLNFNLGSMVRRYLGLYVEKDKYEDIRTRTISNEVLYNYGVLDSVLALRVAQEQKKLLDENPVIKKVYETTDAPMIWVVLDMQPTKIDTQGWLELAAENESKGRSIEAEIGLNVYAYVKVKERIASELGLHLVNTEDETLAEHKQFELIQKIRKAREYRKAASTYGQKWIANHVDEMGEVHCNWNVTGAETGRESSSNPNLQNIPSRKMPIFRTFFLPIWGTHIIADVSQQEPRLTALASKDKNLTAIFVNHEDVHTATARLIFEDPTIVKGDERRKIGKETGLGIVYGLTAQGLTAKLKEVVTDPNIEINDDKSQGYIDIYFRKFPRVKSYLDRVVMEGHKNEFVTTYYGRRCWINIHNYGWENNCKNAPIQGGGADMIKMWQIKLWNLCRQEQVRYPVCLVVHDEIVLDVAQDEVEFYLRILDLAFKEAIETLYPESPVPFEFEHSEGPNWGAKK